MPNNCAFPKELTEDDVWCNWRYEDHGGKKLTKVPYCSRTGKKASVSDRSTWSSYETAVEANQYYDGLGRIFDGSGITGIDLDDPSGFVNSEEVAARHTAIVAAIPGYWEVSPSGKGLHGFAYAQVPSGRRREAVELYCSGRFFTMTGNVFQNLPIQNHNEIINQLWVELGGDKNKDVVNAIDQPEVSTDYEILTQASSAINGDKFISLYEGNWENLYPSQSEADFALVNILQFYTQNKAQIIRIFRASALGKRAKAQRDDYFLNARYGIVQRAFDRQPEPLNLDTLHANLEKQLQAKTVKAESVEQSQLRSQERVKYERALDAVKEPSVTVKKHSKNDISEFKYTIPPGLLGELAVFIHDAAPRPVPEIAIAGAIGLMSGICGRSYNVSGTGVNQYILLLGFTGSGKEAISGGIDKIMTEVVKTVPDASKFIGPGEIASAQALQKFLARSSNCFMSLVGEFGLKFRQLCGDRASTNDIGLKRIFLDLYNKSGRSSILKPLIYSDKDKNTEAIQSPAFSMLGETTPETFYENLDSGLISDGLLPRFTIIEYKGKRPALNENHLHVSPSQQLMDRFAALCAYSLQLNNGNNALEVQIDSEALKLFKDFDKHCDNQINHASNDVTRQLWNRAHIKSLKLSALLAVGVNYIQPAVNVECATWALQLITQDVQNLLSRFESGEIGVNNVQNDQATDIKKVIKKYITGTWDEAKKYAGCNEALFTLKIIPHSYISASCRQRASFKNDRLGPVQAISNAIKNLIDCGEIVELSPMDKKSKNLTDRAKLYVVNSMQL